MKRLLFLLLALAVSARAQTPAPALQLDLGKGVRIDMLLVQPGTFQQGSPPGEAGREADEGPQRRVTITRPFYMGKFPVTRGQFARFVEATRFRTEAEKGESGGYGVVDGKLVQKKQFTWRNPGFEQTDEHPVALVSALDAAAFCRWLSDQARRQCELPTEAQWEYACRAGTTLAHSAEPLEAAAWYRQNSVGITHPVGEKKPNAWGFHDMYGPVWQWCRDWYAPYTPANANDPLQTNSNLSDKPRQVLRGGSFLSDIAHARSAERYRNDARSRNADNGFRIICSLTQRAAAAAPSQPTERRALPPAQPRAPAAPPAGPGVSGVGVLFGILLILGLPLAIVGVVVWQIVKAVRGRAAAPPPLTANGLTGPEAAALFSARPGPMGHRFAFNLTDDGFFVTGPEEAVGSHLRYECTVAGREIADDLVFTPGPEGHFIFTGKRPSSVRVQTTGGAAGTSSSGMTHGSSLHDDDYRNRMSSSSSSRYPSAY